MEWLTDKMEEETMRYFDRIEQLGGVLPAIDKGFFQREIAEASYRLQQEIEDGRRTIVGVNKFVMEDEIEIPILEMDKKGEEIQNNRLKKLRKDRNQSKLDRALAALRKAAQGDENTMPYILDCVHAYGTLGETCDVLREVFGEYKEPAIF
jgi:methylmalonyl-CoA mutase N-terminal domain/subunit